ncbi:MAG: PTS sugar transporter subunit IIA [Hespellia sp.]|nr:PTS sugar transporter subunit IIA [Hespellia sp.]
MKRKFLIATHSTFAQGIRNTLEMILGEQPSVSTLCAYTDGASDIESSVKKIVDSLEPDEELIIATDLFGGSVNNAFMNYISHPHIHLIAGVNLPLLFELLTNSETLPAEELIENAVSNAKEQILYCNSLLTQTITEDVF